METNTSLKNLGIFKIALKHGFQFEIYDSIKENVELAQQFLIAENNSSNNDFGWITKDERFLNIFTNAIELGFEFQNGSLEENVARAEYFLTKNPSARSIEEQCEIDSDAQGNQTFTFDDDLGYRFVYNDGGEIVEFQKYYGIYEETKVFFMTLVNSLGIVVNLYIVLQVYC
jgi:hypothetical protein